MDIKKYNHSKKDLEASSETIIPVEMLSSNIINRTRKNPAIKDMVERTNLSMSGGESKS